MNHSDFEKVFEDQVDKCRKMLIHKGKEYADDENRLHNFQVAAALQSESQREALGGMLAKHIVSVYDLIHKDELAHIDIWEEKLGDALNYLFLLKAIVINEQKETNAQA